MCQTPLPSWHDSRELPSERRAIGTDGRIWFVINRRRSGGGVIARSAMLCAPIRPPCSGGPPLRRVRARHGEVDDLVSEPSSLPSASGSATTLPLTMLGRGSSASLLTSCAITADPRAGA